MTAQPVPPRPEGIEDDTWDLVVRAAQAGVLAQAPTRGRPTVEELRDVAAAFTEAVGGKDAALAVWEQLWIDRGVAPPRTS